ncbi:AAA family ATPase [Jatrophihabitans sp. DSM 45814]
MQLHRMSMSAIGPFAGQVDIDFSRLGGSGLFLLEGPTGSGKSTVIDAISFALYGKVAQTGAHRERLRSHHADPAAEPVVELVFETQGGIYRIRRTPSFERPKKKGTGSTPVNATVKIWRLNTPDDRSSGEPLSTRISEADDEITRAIGLSHEQFVQTVVLPQGEFATFLKSKTDDKRALLQKLFGTEVLSRTQQRLVEGRRAAEVRRASTTAAIGKTVQAFVGASGAAVDTADRADLLIEHGDSDGLKLLIDSALTELAAAAKAAAATTAKASRSRIRAQHALDSARDLLRRQTKRAELAARRDQLAVGLDAISARRDELDAAERARRVESAATSLAMAIARSDDAQIADTSARSSLPAELKAAAEAELRERAALARGHVGELAADIERENRLPRLQVALSETLLEAERIADQLVEARAELEHLPELLSQYRAQRSAFAADAARQPSLAAEADRAADRLAASVRATAAAVTLSQDRQITLAAHAAWEQKEQSLALMRLSWRASVAGELGQQLADGYPCVVCGSAEHPQPARPGKHDVGQDDLDRAEAESKRLRVAMQAAQEQLAKQEAEIAELQYIADQLSPDQAQIKVDELNAALQAAAGAAQRCDELDSQISDAESRSTVIAEHVSTAEIGRASLVERAAALETKIADDSRQLEQVRASYRSVAERRDSLQAQVNDLEMAAAAAQSLSTADAHALECGAGFQQALAAAGFAAEADCLAARRSDDEVSGLRITIKAFDDEWAGVHSQLVDPELLDRALDNAIPDLEPLVAALAESERIEAEHAALSGSARDRLEGATRHAHAIDKALAAGSQVLIETAPIIRLGNLAAGSGDNQLKMELTTYALIRRFAEVVSAANTQLRRVSGGRYELQHSDARSGNAKSGLGLTVLDLHTGRPRDPGTLSGGETFYVSLSLALGLADVVRAEAGGVDLGTLFIDEGFGSLDPEVLDEVLGVLDSLRAAGRTVGVVSHVAEMKSRIAERIEIRHNADGSSRLTVLA